MSASQELIDAVRSRTQGTPYVVEPTAEGFDVRLVLDDPQWFGTYRERRMTSASVHHVKVRESARTLSVTDELRSLTWRAGADGRKRPTMSAGIGFASGKLRERGVRRTYTLGSAGLTQESETSFDTAAGRHLVLDAAQALGWKVERGLHERIGLFVGVGTIVLLVLAGLVVGIVALAGGFS